MAGQKIYSPLSVLLLDPGSGVDKYQDLGSVINTEREIAQCSS